MSEIDDIFASKGKPTAPQPVASMSTLSEKKKKKDKKRKREVDPEDNAEISQRNWRPAPQTITDPSILIPSLKPPKIDRAEASKSKVSKSTAQGADDKDRFKDSRGSVSSRCPYLHYVSLSNLFAGRKTTEGWSIYKEDELGIHNEGGGKLSKFCVLPLFTSIWAQAHHSAPLTVTVVSPCYIQTSFLLTPFIPSGF